MFNDKQNRHDSLVKQIVKENFAKIAKITAINGKGYYNVETSGGAPYTNVVCLDYASKYQVGQWVTLEYYGGDWAIVGRAAYKGGD